MPQPCTGPRHPPTTARALEQKAQPLAGGASAGRVGEVGEDGDQGGRKWGCTSERQPVAPKQTREMSPAKKQEPQDSTSTTVGKGTAPAPATAPAAAAVGEGCTGGRV